MPKTEEGFFYPMTFGKQGTEECTESTEQNTLKSMRTLLPSTKLSHLRPFPNKSKLLGRSVAGFKANF